MGNSFTTHPSPHCDSTSSIPPGTFVTRPAGPPQARGFYAAQTDLENLAGRQNLAAYSQLDANSALPDVPRIAQALAYADAEIDNFFRDGPYVLSPHLAILSGHSTPAHWAAVIAVHWLYRARFLQNIVPGKADANPFQQMLVETRTDMSLYKAGQKRLDAVRVQSLPTGPVVVVTN